MRTTGSVVFLFSSLTLLACVLYLPQHIVFISNRAWFYIGGYHAGDSTGAAIASSSNKDNIALSVSSALGSAATAAAKAATTGKGEL